MKKAAVIKKASFFLVFLFSLVFIPSVIAPVWYGSGDDSDLSGNNGRVKRAKIIRNIGCYEIKTKGLNT